MVKPVNGDAYLRTLNSLFEKVGRSKASLWIDKRTGGYTLYFELKPISPRAAPITGTIQVNGDIDINIASLTTVLESNGDYNDPKHLVRFEQICEAVVGGRYEEIIYLVGATQLGVTGIIHLPTGDLKLRDVKKLSLKWFGSRKQTKRIAFEPY